jgi:ATP-dependent Lon protease
MPEIEIELYDAELFAAQTDEPEGDWISAVESDRSDREPARQKVLAEIQKHRLGNKRKLAVGSQKMVDRIAGLAAAAPHFRETLGLIRRAVLLSMRTSVQLSVPPLLLVSEPGLGKTWLARRLAEAIGVPMGEYSFASGDDPGVLTGHSLSWRGARAGLVARTLLFGDFASPVIFIDEVDKSMSLHGEDPTDCLNALLEPENARRYTDQFVELPVRADHVIWILTANNIDGLRPSLIDRTLVMRVGRPTDDEQVRVLRSIVDEALAPYADVGPTVSDEALRGLSACSPRLAKKIVVLAFAYAAADNRLEISADDIESARRIAGGHGGRRPVGFNAF